MVCFSQLMTRWVVVVLLCKLLAVLAAKGFPRPLHANEIQKYRDLAAAAPDSERDLKVTRALSRAAGVYVDDAKSSSLDLQKTVVVLTAFSDNHSKDTLYNFFCFMKSFGIKILLSHTTEFITLSHDFDFVTTLRFPVEDIWQSYTRKNIKYQNRDQWVGYSEELLIQNHGTGLKFFPLMELLMHDYNIIYFDQDIGFLYDPIPYLWQGLQHTPDVISSLEVMRCKPEPNNPNSFVSINGRATYMPNSGTLMVRSSEAGKTFLRWWINRTVEGNWYNEQYSFEWPKGFVLSPLESCNRLPNGLVSGSTGEVYSPPNLNAKDSSKELRFCFLNKYLFQTGMILFGCQYRNYYGNLSNTAIKETIRNDKSVKEYFFPVNAHVNGRTPKSFKSKKQNLLKELGLWIYKTSSKRDAAAKSIFQCDKLYLNTTRWVKQIFKPIWHPSGYFSQSDT